MSKKSYWDNFYTKTKSATATSFDWFFSHDVANQWLTKYITQGKTQKNMMNILELGCGTSTLASNLLKEVDDCISIVSIDFSLAAVKQARMISHQTSIQYAVADASSLPFRSNQFDVVFEKGTFDAMLKNSNGNLAGFSFGETVRVLTPCGTFLQFSDENPDLRLSFLEAALQKNNVDRSKVSVTFQEIGHYFGTEYFLYITNFTNSSQ